MTEDTPLLPYAGTSGWSGSETSRERAETQDTDGTTSARQTETLNWLRERGTFGVTWKELANIELWHHGQASGVLSVLHKVGRIARLTERRDRCAVYVLPEYVNGRETAPHGRQRTASAYEWAAVLPDGTTVGVGPTPSRTSAESDADAWSDYGAVLHRRPVGDWEPVR